MIKIALLSFFLFVGVSPALAADLGTPILSPPLHPQSNLLDADRFLTTGGVRYAPGAVTLEPLLGVSHRALERDTHGATSESVHNVNAQAGWRLSLPKTLYLSAAAQLPVFTYESAGRSIGGQDVNTHQSYDVGHSLRGGLSWTGEFGLHLLPGADLTLYYDQSQLGTLPGLNQQEQRVGTRLIWHFK